jgi:hypothetical protein
MDSQSEFEFIAEQWNAPNTENGEKRAVVSKASESPSESPVCHWVYVIEELGGYCGGVDYEPIVCKNCHTAVTEYRTRDF